MGGYFVLAAENSHPAQLYRDPHAGIKLCFGWLGRTYWELEYRGGRSRRAGHHSVDLTVVCTCGGGLQLTSHGADPGPLPALNPGGPRSKSPMQTNKKAACSRAKQENRSISFNA